MTTKEQASSQELVDNNLVRRCNSILILFGDLKATQEITQDYSTLTQDLEIIIKKLEKELESEKFDTELVKLTSYTLCCALDEAIFHIASLSDTSSDMNKSLLFIFHNEYPRSDNLLMLAKRIIDQRDFSNIEVQKLICMLIQMGYKGQSPDKIESSSLLYSIKRILANNIAEHNDAKPLFNPIDDTVKPTTRTISSTPLWVMLSFSAFILSSVYLASNLYLSTVNSHYLSKMLSKDVPEQTKSTPQKPNN